MAFLLTKYLGGKRYESKCVKCKETLLWTQGDDVPMVFFQNEDIGFLCPSCYNWAKKIKTPANQKRPQ